MSEDESDESKEITRRDVLKFGLVAGGAALIAPWGVREVLAHCPENSLAGQCLATTEVYPTSPLIGGRTVRVTKGKQTTFTVSRAIGNFDAFTEYIEPPTPLQPESPFSNPVTSRPLVQGDMEVIS